MRIALRRCLTLGLIFTASYAQLEGAATESEPAITLNLHVYNYAHIPNPTLLQAQQELTRIFIAMGIKSEWVDANTWILPENAFAGSASFLTVVILGRSGAALAPDEQTMGFSSAKQARMGKPAYVIYSRVEDFVGKFERPAFRMMRMGLMLADVIAHELGHLLLPTTSHSHDGIMCSPWKNSEFNLALRGRLLFTMEQAELIRNALATQSR